MLVAKKRMHTSDGRDSEFFRWKPLGSGVAALAPPNKAAKGPRKSRILHRRDRAAETMHTTNTPAGGDLGIAANNTFGYNEHDSLMAAYGNGAALPKRRKISAPTGKWFAVMFARNRETSATKSHTERTQIKYTSHIGGVFVSANACDDDGGGGGGARKLFISASPPYDCRSKSQWRVVLALGPIRDESEAMGICRLWSSSQKSVLHKAARGEAISIRLEIPGFVDWDTVFGSAKRLSELYTVVFYKNPSLRQTIQFKDTKEEEDEEEEEEEENQVRCTNGDVSNK